MPPDEVVAAAETEPNADDVFAAAFAQLSEADTKANGPMPKPEPNPNAHGQRTEEDRSTSEAQRDAKAFAKPDVVGPTGPASDATVAGMTGATGGATGATGVGATGGLPADDKEKAAADALAAAEAAKVVQAATGPTGGQGMGDDELVKRLANLIKTAEPADDKSKATVVDPLAMYNAEEKKFLVEYEKEYPDIARAEFMRRRVENQHFATWIFKQINDALGPQLEQIAAIATRTHAGDLQQAVPSYDNALRDKVVEWADKQPAYKKVAYQYVITQGTVDEVADMIADFTKSTNYVAPVKTPVVAAAGAVDPAKATADAAKATADAAKAAAAAKLAPVKSGNAQRAVTAIAPADYDGAFDWATKLLEKA